LVGDDREVGTERSGELELALVAPKTGDGDERRAGLLRGDHRAQAPLAAAQDDDRVAHRRARPVNRPVDAGAERVVERGQLHREVGVDPVHKAVRVEVQVVGIRAPQRGRLDVDRDVRVTRHAAVPDARLMVSLDAVLAGATRQQRLHDDSVALPHAPAPARVPADLRDATDGFVSGDDGVAEPGVVLTLVLRPVAPADAARLDPQQGIVVTDRWQRELPHLQRARRRLDDRSTLLGHCPEP
jgi:hypothetical protein